MRKMNLWKIGAMMGIVLTLAFCVEACAEWSFQEAAKPYRGKTLTMIGEAYAPWEAYTEIAKDFEKLTGIKLDMESFDFAAVMSKFTADAVSKTGYLDALQINTLYLARGAENGWILSNDFFADKPEITNPDFNPLEEFPEIYEAACYYEGKYYGVPYMFQAPAFAYRKDLAENPVERQAFFEKYGYELPAPPKTWAQFYDLVEFFTRKKGEKLAGKTLDESFYGIAIGLKRYIATPFFFTIYLAGIGGCNVLGPNGEIITETPVFRRAMEFYMSLRKFTPPGVLEYTWDETNTDMMMGRLFLVHGWPGEQYVPDLIEAADNPDLKLVTLDLKGDASVWMTPPIQMEAVDKVVQALGQIDADNKTYYEERATQLKEAIQVKGEELKARLEAKGGSQEKVLCNEMQFGFVKWAGFDIIDTYGRPESLTPAKIQELIDHGREGGASLVIDNLQSGPGAGAPVAREIGAVHVTLSNFPGAVEDTGTWAKAIEHNVSLLLEAVGR